MNRNDTAAYISPDLKKYIFCTAVWGTLLALATVIGVVFFCATLNVVGIYVIADIPSSEYWYMFNVLCFLLTVGLSVKGVAKSTECEIRDAWMDLYKRTAWKTPGGEVGSVVDVALNGDWLELVFAGGDKHRYAFRHLSPVGEAQHAGMNGPDRNRMPNFQEVRGMVPVYGALCLTFLVVWCIPVVSLWNMMSFALAVSLVILFAAAVGFTWSIIDQVRRLMSPSNISDHTANMAQTRWKSLDGKVGVVRWADRDYVGEGRYQESLVLSFPDGGVRSFRREDLLPMAFEREAA